MDKATYLFNKLAESTVKVTDDWFIPRDTLKEIHSGQTFMEDDQMDKKLMYEGYGLEKFKGNFKNLDKFKGPVHVDDVEIKHAPKMSKQELQKVTEQLRRQIYGKA